MATTEMKTAEEYLEDEKRDAEEFEIEQRLEDISSELSMEEDLIGEYLGAREETAEYARLLQSIASLKEERTALQRRLAELAS